MMFFEALGFKSKMLRIGADGGVDVLLYEPVHKTPIGVAQCKAWLSQKVGVAPVRELLAAMAAEHVKNGIFVTTSTFSEEAKAFARGKEIELVDGTALISFIKQLPVDRQKALMDAVFKGDYITPTCPNCDVKMVRRTAKTGEAAGSQVWGCPRAPGCKHTFMIRDDASF